MTIYIMEIIKIFSNTNDEERLYSALLSEDEMKLYSKFKGSRKLWESRVLDELPENYANQKKAGETLKNLSKDQVNEFLNGATSAKKLGVSDLQTKNSMLAERSLRAERADVRKNTYRKGLGIDTLAEKKTNGMKDYVMTFEDKKRLQEYRNKRAARQTPKPVSTPTPNLPVVSTPATNVAKETTTKVTSVVPKNITAKEALNKKASSQYLKKGMNFVKNHKLGVGLGAAGLTAAGATGAYLYNKKKNQ